MKYLNKKYLHKFIVSELSQTKISDFQHALMKKYILRFKIPMQYFMLMNVLNSSENLYK